MQSMLPSQSHISDALVTRLATLRRLRGPAVPDFSLRVRELVVVASSSRGGSSMLAETLRESSALLHLHAEINPFLRLVGVSRVVVALTLREEAEGAGRLCRRLGWEPVVRLEQGWSARAL